MDTKGDTQPLHIDNRTFFTHELVHIYIMQLEYEIDYLRAHSHIQGSVSNAQLDEKYKEWGQKRLNRVIHGKEDHNGQG